MSGAIADEFKDVVSENLPAGQFTEGGPLNMGPGTENIHPELS